MPQIFMNDKAEIIPFLRVVIPAYNTGATVEACIAALLAQDHLEKKVSVE